ncbi:DNA polymerase III subunit delta [Altererythrobacter sp. TH136]|uniref:DNA polymerase III subunit delta n=1 Tax=Altererythrobacter sp. TH136 TaxID=2067415 RepID=UPI0011650FC1|nr:DNA polymerase III subunit delta [Altererythrobacter sp. TH136]QDM40964.1 DNA polymerase III subunit delta [Altererythrobacter sp. TH136]
MKATQKDFLAVAPRAVRAAKVFFFCGPDEAGAAAAAQRIADLLEEPGERVELSGADLRKDPVLLADEARSTSLFAGARHIVARVSGDEAHDALANHVAAIDAGEGEPCPVLVVATSATDKARTAKLLEKRGDALVAMFWPPDLASVRDAVRTMGDELGLKLSGEMAERIARAAALDVRLAQSEVTKLAIYLDAVPSAPVAADAEALDAIGARTEDDGFMPLVNAVLAGRTARLSSELHRMRELSLNPVGLLLAFERRVAQLAQLNARLGPREEAAAFVSNEARARRVFWKDERDLADQLGRWKGPRMARLVARLVELHRDLLANSAAGETLLAQALARIAREANR